MSSLNTKSNILVFGYIRLIQKMMKYQIIPTSIIDLCLQFYLFHKPFIYITGGDDQWGHTNIITLPSIYLSDFIPSSSYIYWKCKLTDLETLHRGCNYSINEKTAICCGYNIKLPKTLITSIKDTYTSTSSMIDINTCADIIFHYGGNKGCMAYIIDPNQYNIIQSKEIIHSYIWKLPSISDSMCVNLTYSAVYGLIGLFTDQWSSAGQEICCLSFDIDKEDYYKQNKAKWRWQHVVKLADKRIASCFTMFDKNKLLICGGSIGDCWYGTSKHLISNIDIYDIHEGKWTKMNDMIYKREKSGICINNNKIYIGGGRMLNTANVNIKSNTVEFCDINKNQWNQLPNTNKLHYVKPILWMENQDILFIASTVTNVIERLDLRENKWTKMSESLNKFFNAPKMLDPRGRLVY